MMLAAGLGTRLWPLTAERGKPAVPFLGRSFIRGMLDWVSHHGARRVVVNTHHRPASIEAALADVPSDLEVRFSPEPEILGTAGALGQARDAGLLDSDRTTLVVNAKLVTDLDLGAAWATHERTSAAVTMILRSNPRKEAFTTVKTSGHRVTGFGPSRVPLGDDPKLFTGLHFLAPSVLARAEARFSDTVRDLYPLEVKAGRVSAHVDDVGVWKEASTLARYLDLHLEAVREGRAGGAAPREAEIGTAFFGPGVAVGTGARVDEVVALAGATVGAGCVLRRCILTEGVFVPEGTVLEGRAVAPAALAETAPQGCRDRLEPMGELVALPLD